MTKPAYDAVAAAVKAAIKQGFSVVTVKMSKKMAEAFVREHDEEEKTNDK